MRIRLLLPVVLLLLLVCGPVYTANRARSVRGDVVVKFKPGVGDDEIEKISAAYGTHVVYTSPFAGFKSIKGKGGKKVEDMVGEFRGNPNVEYAVPNSMAYAHLVPNDPYYNPYQWNFDDQVPGGNPYGGANGGGINLEPAWDISGGSGAVVAVVDTGVAYENYLGFRRAPDLATTNFVAGWDFVNNDAHPNDDNSHGTHVTGTIAQNTNNSKGVAGVAFECSIMPVKVLDTNGGGTLQEVVDGIYYAVDHGADVINMSLGWTPGYDPGQPLKYALEYAYDNGVTVVCSSGNDGASTVSYPAAYWTTIAVGATRYDETRSAYSNYGSALDLMAPGGDLSVDQNGDGYGDGILQNTFSPFKKDPRSFSYWLFDGTSMAAPHVSGVAALLIANGTVGPDDIRYALKSTAEDKGAAGWDSQYGWGIVDAYAALNAPPNEDRKFTLSDSQLMAFDDTYVTPRPWFADLTEKSDPEGLGVEYDVTLYGAWGIEIGVGGAPPQTDLSGYSEYTLTFTNTSVDDSFNINLYVKTGAGETYYGSGWSMMFPGRQKTLSLNLSSIPDINDVREIGFGLGAWVGSAYGYADAIRVKVERIHSE